MPTNVDIPGLGESVQEAVLLKWHKGDGEAVSKDEPLCELETDKANVDVPAPAAGVLRRVTGEGSTVHIGETIGRIDEGSAGGNGKASAAAKPPAAPPPAKPAAAETASVAPSSPPSAAQTDELSPAVRKLVEENHLSPGDIPATGPGGRITKEDVLAFLEAGKGASAAPPAPTAPPVPPAPAAPPVDAPAAKPSKPTTAESTRPVQSPKPPAAVMTFDTDGNHRAPLTKMRQAIARRLVEAQHTAAILTTFNEVDLTEVIAIRSRHKEAFEKAHGIGLGFMSFFAKATVLALKDFPRVNAFIDGNDVIYHNYVHLGIAVSTDRGLSVPVLRNVQNMSFAKIESEIKRVATASRDNKLSIEELSGGTFTITNGGVFGSMLSTPILTPPQSGILGMHAITRRPMVVGEKIEIRSMMYVALSYDHRIVDGRESVSFLVKLKQLLEDPARLLLEI
jgi:2-oxoglutarate dehydrogenase E2 component (dihydrolipoamide succinyltransferase)